MKSKHRRLILLTISGLAFALSIGLGIALHRDARQCQLNRDLVLALSAYNDPHVMDLLRNGADAKVRESTSTAKYSYRRALIRLFGRSERTVTPGIPKSTFDRGALMLYYNRALEFEHEDPAFVDQPTFSKPNEAVASALLDGGAAPDETDPDGTNAVFWAARFHHDVVLNRLATAGCRGREDIN